MFHGQPLSGCPHWPINFFHASAVASAGSWGLADGYVLVHIAWTGGMRFTAGKHDGPRIAIDADGIEAPSPVVALLIACGTCSASDVVSILEKKRIKLTRFQIEVGGNRKEDYPRRFTEIWMRFTLAGEGLTEAAARKAHGEIDIYKASFRPMRHVLAGRDERMLMKLVVDAKSQRVLGVHILGPDAGEMAQLAGIAVKMGATKAQFDATMAVHPTAAEELVTMRTKWTGA